MKLKRRDKTGFTLIELIIATAISALVLGILSVCFSFALRVWQSTQDQKPDQTFQLADLLKRQLAECDPTPVKFTDSVHPVFAGQPNSIAFVTAHSVKAISQGVPVVARYIYDPNSKMLYYSELLLDPYHSKSIERFLADSLPAKRDKIRSYGVDFLNSCWPMQARIPSSFYNPGMLPDELPVEVLLRWRGQDSVVHARYAW